MDASNVTAGKPNTGGAVYNAPLGTALPTDTDTALNASFKDVGHISEDGVTNSFSLETETVKAWGNKVVMITRTSRDSTYKFKMLEAKLDEVLKVVHGHGNVTGSLAAGLSVAVNSDDQEARSWVINMILSGNVKKRIVIPKGSITDIGDVVYKDNEPIGYEITITAQDDADGNKAYEYMKQPQG